VSSTLLTRIGEPVTTVAGFTAIDDAALVIEDDAVAWTGPGWTAPPAWPAASQPPRTGGSALPSSGDTSAKTSKIFGDLKLFEPKTRCPFLAVRDREER
jgi:hypothetical protein